MNGISAPYFFAVSAISSESVFTVIRVISLDSFAARMLYAIKGCCNNSLIFFPGRPLLPPLAGIIASISRIIAVFFPCVLIFDAAAFQYREFLFPYTAKHHTYVQDHEQVSAIPELRDLQHDLFLSMYGLL